MEHFIRRSLISLLVAVPIGIACEDDPVRPPDDTATPKFENLSQRNHVLNNLELDYNLRNFSRYDQLLDTDFTFYFDEADVGGEIPAQWGRVEDLDVTSRLFDTNQSDPSYPRCKHIEMDIATSKDMTWVEYIPAAFPEEVWYQTDAFYDFQFELEPDITLVPFLGSTARFVVRNVGTENVPEWRLVELRDLGPSSMVRRTSGPDVMTWGGVKALYQ